VSARDPRGGLAHFAPKWGHHLEPNAPTEDLPRDDPFPWKVKTFVKPVSRENHGIFGEMVRFLIVADTDYHEKDGKHQSLSFWRQAGIPEPRLFIVPWTPAFAGVTISCECIQVSFLGAPSQGENQQRKTYLGEYGHVSEDPLHSPESDPPTDPLGWSDPAWQHLDLGLHEH
jgi:hypothetical protein